MSGEASQCSEKESAKEGQKEHDLPGPSGLHRSVPNDSRTIKHRVLSHQSPRFSDIRFPRRRYPSR